MGLTKGVTPVTHMQKSRWLHCRSVIWEQRSNSFMTARGEGAWKKGPGRLEKGREARGERGRGPEPGGRLGGVVGPVWAGILGAVSVREGSVAARVLLVPVLLPIPVSRDFLSLLFLPLGVMFQPYKNRYIYIFFFFWLVGWEASRSILAPNGGSTAEKAHAACYHLWVLWVGRGCWKSANLSRKCKPHQLCV